VRSKVTDTVVQQPSIQDRPNGHRQGFMCAPASKWSCSGPAASSARSPYRPPGYLAPGAWWPSTAAARLLGMHGRLVNLGSSAGPAASYDSAHLRSHTASILGYTNNDITDAQRRDALQAVLRHAGESGLAVGYEVVDIDEVSSAWQRQATGTTDQRLVLRITV
jgi:hypothetical protein